jgi:hypothetical protein
MDAENSIYQKEMARIAAMPEGPAKQAKIAELTRDYKGRGARGDASLEDARKRMAGAMDMPTASVAGNAKNPFAISVAPSALQYGSKMLEGYNAMQDRDKAETDLEDLSKGQEAALGGVLAGAAANPGAPGMAGIPGLGRLTEEERMQLMMSGQAAGLRNQ